MIQVKKIIALISICSVFLSGCGRGNSSNTKEATLATTSPKSVVTITPDPNALNPTTPSPQTGSFSCKKKYNDANIEISILGLKEYKKIKGEKYTDSARKDEKYLVLFLKIHNRKNENTYFHPDYLKAKVNGQSVEHTVVFNDPEGYPTIFHTIDANSYYAGFVVWSVPNDWKNLKLKYTGWKGSDGLTLNCTLHKKEVHTPEKYDALAYQ